MRAYYHYYIIYHRGFLNEYSLYKVVQRSLEEDFLLQRGYERITRKQAFELCAEENRRSRDDSMFSGYASSTVREFTAEDMDDWRCYEAHPEDLE